MLLSHHLVGDQANSNLHLTCIFEQAMLFAPSISWIPGSIPARLRPMQSTQYVLDVLESTVGLRQIAFRPAA